MHRPSSALVALVLVLGLLAQSLSVLAQAPSPAQPLAVAPGVVLVELRPGVSLVNAGALGAQASDPALAAAFARLGVTAAEPLLPMGEGGLSASAVGRSPLGRVYRLRLPANADVLAAARELEASGTVEYAEPDYLAHVLTTPNDPRFGEQWGLPQIGAPSAWDVVTGSADVTIAVVDSGLDTSHPDLAGQLWVNPGEIAGNGVDDDANGRVDDVNGWNIVGNNAAIGDNFGHGTQVAGAIAAAANNGQGVAGLCWGCRLMVVKVTDGAAANYSDIAAGILYAAQKGADVINVSLGGASDSTTLRAAVESASQTAVVVAGVGNDGAETRLYPAAYDDFVLAVASTTSADSKAASSNYGAWVDVTAPGQDILTTYSGGGYGIASGTSLAAAFASGLAGLLRSQHPDWTAGLARAHVVQTAANVDAFNPGLAGKLGSGRISAAAAVATAASPDIELAGYSVDGRANGWLKVGAASSLVMTLRNDWLGAASVTATLSSADGAVSIGKPGASYGAIASGTAASNSTDAFQVTVAAGNYGRTIAFNLHVLADGTARDIPLSIATESTVVSVSGTIAASNALWTNDRVYQVIGNVLVPVGVTLVIQPGTTVKFNQGKYMLVQGTLIADGTASQPIVFTANSDAPTAGFWGGTYGLNQGGIMFDSLSQPAQFDVSGNYIGGSILRYTVIEYSAGVGMYSAAPLVDNNVLRFSGGPGSALFYTGAQSYSLRPVISRNRILSCNAGTTSPAISATQGSALITGNIVTGCASAAMLSGNVVFSHNVVTRNGAQNTPGLPSTVTGAIQIAYNGSPSMNDIQIHGNSIFGNALSYDISFPAFTPPVTAGVVVDATNNYWGTTDPAAIEARIYHSYDDFNLGTVNYTPFLSAPDPAAPPILTSAALNPPSPVGIQQATFTLSFSAPMDQSVDPTVEFVSSKANTWTTYNTSSNTGLPSDYVNDVAVDIDGSLWFATGSGLARLVGTTWTVYRHGDAGLSGYTDVVSAVAIDAFGVKWIVWDADLIRFDGSSWVSLKRSSSAGAMAAEEAFTQPGGVIWLSNGMSEAVARYDGATWTRYTKENSGLPSNGVRDIAFDSDGSVWFATGAGAARFDGATWSVYNTSNSGLPSNNVRALGIDSRGTKWFALEPATPTSIVRLGGSTWTSYGGDSATGTPLDLVYDISFDSEGVAWFASGTRLWRFDGTNWASYLTGARRLAIDAQGNKWCALMGPGASVLWSDTPYPVTENARWLDDHTWQATFDFTSLVPRGDYVLHVSGAKGLDGMEMPEDTRFSFTVDYAGTISDQTPPAPPSIFASGVKNDASQVTARWSAYDGDSGVTTYRYAIGTAPGAADIVSWTTTAGTSVTRARLGLVEGRQYWLAVQARNAGGLWSAASYSAFTAGRVTIGNLYVPLLRR